MTFGRKNEELVSEHGQIMKIHMQFDADIHTTLYRKRYPKQTLSGKPQILNNLTFPFLKYLPLS